MANFLNPDVYDATAKVHRPMTSGVEAVNPALVPLSARAGNTIQSVGDGLYVGGQLGSTAYYVNSSTGVDDPAHGTKAAPFRSLDYALAYLSSQSPFGQYRAADTTIALQAGQSFSMNADFNIYGGRVTLTFYGDAQYGDFNGAPIGTGAAPAWMADLNRPVITFAVQNISAQWYMNGINRLGGTVIIRGVKLNLPAAPATPSIGLYSQNIDVVRSPSLADAGYVQLVGSIVNMTDTNAYFGFLGVQARALGLNLTQFASQFQINGLLMNAASGPSAAQLLARQYFIKLYADIPGNTTTSVLSPTSANSSSGSGILNLSWTDTEALTVTTGKTNLGTFPANFDLSYGIRNYFFGLQKDQQSRPLNVISPRLI
jgi:hypothetical protein